MNTQEDTWPVAVAKSSTTHSDRRFGSHSEHRCVCLSVCTGVALCRLGGALRRADPQYRLLYQMSNEQGSEIEQRESLDRWTYSDKWLAGWVDG